jgi:hypothetical protein
MQHFFKPRPPVMRELLKLLIPMQSWDAVVAMHVRTGFADFQNAWVRRVMPTVKPAELAKMEAKFPCGTEDIVRGLGQVFEQCKPDYSNQICSHWWELPDHLQKKIDLNKATRRGPTIQDGIEQCFECSWCSDIVPKDARVDLVYNSAAAGDGALAAAVTCASRLAAHIAVDEVARRVSARRRLSRDDARVMAAQTARDRWGLYILGDSPAMIKALSHDAQLSGRVMYQSDEDVIGVTMSQVVCNEEQVCTGALAGMEEEDDDGSHLLASRADALIPQPRGAKLGRRGGRRGGRGHVDDRVAEEEGAKKKEAEEDDGQKGGLGHNRGWMRAVVDMYMASLADGDVQLPGSSFMKGAASALSITNRANNALRFGGEVVLDQMVTPEGETTERSVGYEQKPENYVLLSASHCKFEKTAIKDAEAKKEEGDAA